METLRATQRIRLGTVTIVPVQRVRIEPVRSSRGLRLTALAEPSAIVVVAGGDRRAIGPDGAELPLHPLLATVPGLTEALASAEHGAP